MSTAAAETTHEALAIRLTQVMLRDESRLRRRLDALTRTRNPATREQVLASIEAQVSTAEDRITARRNGVPVISYPAELPISARRDDIATAIRDHQVVIVAGETGSGKTTQLPKICLELGRGVRGLIGHTQPRRIAARTVAERVAEELGIALGEAVGYTVRFTDQVGPQTLVKLMTDGILLAEIQRDRLLTAYDTIIIDEAHERSLTIDFLLGYLKQLLPQRPDLKVVITSATIDPQRFSRHFDDAPVIEVSGRTYPVEVRYRPLEAEEDDADDESGAEVRDQIQAICDAVAELCAEGPGDVLVFLSGEREIRDTADALRRVALGRRWESTEVLPLYARLSAAEQHRVFEPHTGRRVVLATNVAETSLTVPGVRYVVDPGTARISRYSNRSKVQRLPIEAVSRASANQRKGRCGRLSDGICIRLYGEDDFGSRPEFTDPEILRTNLASVILQMTALGLGDLAAFPFLDPPDKRQIKDGMDLLHELGALDPGQSDPRRRLTPLGRRLAQLPVDPRLGRMVLEADGNGCVREVMVIAAALSINDPRERPVEHQQSADEKHRRFAHGDSDFVSFLNLWEYLQEKQKELSSSQFRRLCRAEYLNYLRVREWQDLFSQLRQLAKPLEITVNATPLTLDASGVQRIHVSLLAGLLSHIGLKEGERNEYLGARSAKFAIFPGSGLFKQPPRWVMAAELVETSRLWGRMTGKIEPTWVEPLALHLVKRQYSEPHWEAKRGAVVAIERVTLYGVPIVTGRTIGYGRIDPELSRDLFIRHALVEGDWRTHHPFFAANRALLDDVEDLENRARRRDLLVDDETLFDFYDRRLPPDIVSGRHFDSWWKTARRRDPQLLSYTEELVRNEAAPPVAADDYPDTWLHRDLPLALSYHFEPGSENDGVTLTVPLQVLNQIDPAAFDWQVPGLRVELITALLRSLPKGVRRNLVPAPDYARLAVARLTPARLGEPLLPALEQELSELAGVEIDAGDWDLDRVPGHLRITFRIVDETGQVVAEDKDLRAVKRRLAPTLQRSLARATSSIERGGLRSWTFGDLPTSLTQTVLDGPAAGQSAQGYPALVDEGDSVAIRVLTSVPEQQAAMWAGVRRLLVLDVPSPVKSVLGELDTQTKLALAGAPHPNAVALFEDCRLAVLDQLITNGGGLPWDEAGYRALRAHVAQHLTATLLDVVHVVARVLAAAASVGRGLRGTSSLTLLPSLADLREQLAALVYPGFVAQTGTARLPDLLRYLDAAQHRLDALPERPARDRDLTGRVAQVQLAYDEALAAWREQQGQLDSPLPTDLVEVRWMIEELRVSFFAQTLRTPYPVSEKRIIRALDLRG